MARAAREACGAALGGGERNHAGVDGNDAENAAMLALNRELGFRPFAVETEWVKPLT